MIGHVLFYIHVSFLEYSDANLRVNIEQNPWKSMITIHYLRNKKGISQDMALTFIVPDLLIQKCMVASFYFALLVSFKNATSGLKIVQSE